MIEIASYFTSIFIEHQRLFWSFIIGATGSAAYFTALYFKFVGYTDAHRNIIIEPFRKTNDYFFNRISGWKVLWYCCVGGAISLIFQISTPQLVAIQGFILGAAWPSVVSQYLSGRMGKLSDEEADEIGINEVQRDLGEPANKNKKTDSETITRLENMRKKDDI